MSLRYKKLELLTLEFLDQIPIEVTPGLALQAYFGGQKIVDIRWRETFTYYDWASLTKPLFTVMAFAKAWDKGLINLEDPVKKWLPDFPDHQVTVFHALNHQTGLAHYKPYYLEFPPIGDSKYILKIVHKSFGTFDASRRSKSIYSDLGYWCLIPILESIFQKKLEQIWQEEVLGYFYPLMDGLHFCIQNKPAFQPELYAPTARCSWRHELIRGKVHDEHAFLFGGISTHAGLFGSIDHLSWVVMVIRAQILGFGKKLLRKATIDKFFTRSIPVEQGDWAMGFMLPSIGKSSAGQYFSERSIGHTGFTGTSFWFDPKNDFAVMILSNRVFYGRDYKVFNDWRPKIHDFLAKQILNFS